ncbi:restriction endonuclease [Streptomyces sp. BR1]|uniref:restriction endonuclease n=1 Tax=Streptomyces sp. BR1 TaxID=1592323 RepID=UPI00402BAD47
MLDFTELPKDGEAFELLVRDVAMLLGFKARWSGRGPDGGRDLLLEEPGSPLLGGKIRYWLVSCKHMAHANGGMGRSVGLDDIGADGGIIDAVTQHQAQGYLLACSTQPSSAVVTRLEAIERNKGVPVHVWDSADIERALDTEKGWPIAQRFLPKSAGGWRVISTGQSNEFTGVTRGYYIKFANRDGSRLYTSIMDDCLDLIESIQLPEKEELRPRAVYYDDRYTRLYWKFDYLHPRLADDPAISEPTMRQLARDLVKVFDRSDTMMGVDIDFFVRAQHVSRHSDWYDPDHYTFYEKVRPEPFGPWALPYGR